MLKVTISITGQRRVEILKPTMPSRTATQCSLSEELEVMRRKQDVLHSHLDRVQEEFQEIRLMISSLNRHLNNSYHISNAESCRFVQDLFHKTNMKYSRAQEQLLTCKLELKNMNDEIEKINMRLHGICSSINRCFRL